MIFVDTGAWFAATVPSDPDHAAAANFLRSNRELLITSDYVLDELMTLFKIRGEFVRGIIMGREILEETICDLEWVHSSDVAQAWVAFQSFRDKGWSFTDCVSRSMIRDSQSRRRSHLMITLGSLGFALLSPDEKLGNSRGRRLRGYVRMTIYLLAFSTGVSLRLPHSCQLAS